MHVRSDEDEAQRQHFESLGHEISPSASAPSIDRRYDRMALRPPVTTKNPGREGGSASCGALCLHPGPAFALVLVCTALLLTWPLPLHVASRIPLGSEPTPTVPFLNLWTLGWNATWLGTPEQRYWDAPIFHPTRGAFAFSDPQPGTGLLALPLWQVDRALAYNAVLLLFLALNGIAATRLLRHRGIAFPAALLGGLFCQILPFLTHERGVLQLLPLFGPIWAFDELWRLVEGASWKRGWALAGAILVTFSTSEYYGLFLPVLLLPTVLFNLDRLRRRNAWLGLALGVGLASVPLTALVWSQAGYVRSMGFERSLETIEQYSASPADYTRLSPRTIAGGLLPAPSPKSGAKFLSPGWAMTSLAVLGALAGGGSGSSRRWIFSLVTAMILAFLLSLGPTLTLGAWRPFVLAEAAIPGLAALRSPFRLAILFQLGAAALAALGVDLLLRGKRRALALVGTALVLAELAPRPARLTLVPATIEAESLESPAVFLPFVQGTSARAYLSTAAVMNATLPASLRLVNGYSGFFPLLNAQLKHLLADFPSENGLRALRSLGVRTLLLRLGAMEHDQRDRLAALVQAGQLRDLGRRMELHALGLEGSFLRSAADYDGRWAAEWRWRDEGVELRLTPLELGERFYVSTPVAAPLRWRARWHGRSGRTNGEAVVASRGSFLLYRDGGHSPRITLRLPDDGEAYRVELFDPNDGVRVAIVRVPPRR